MPFDSGIPDLQAVHVGAGIRTQFGILLPPGARVAAYVRSSGMADGDPPEIVNNLVTTVNAGLQRARANRGDLVIALPGHTENIATADAMTGLVAGTRLIGWGRGANMPTLRWTAAAATVLADVADVYVAGLRLRMEGANGVVAPITVSAADCALEYCDIEVCSALNQHCDTMLTVAAGAHRFRFAHNRVRGVVADLVADGILVSGVANDVEIEDNDIFGSFTAATGAIRVNAAALNLRIRNNRIANLTAASVGCISFGAQASTGLVEYNRMSVLNNGVAANQGIVAGATTLARFFENRCSDEPRASGVLAPAACAT